MTDYSSSPIIDSRLLKEIPQTLYDQFFQRVSHNEEFQKLRFDFQPADALLHISEYVKVVIENLSEIERFFPEVYLNFSHSLLISFFHASLKMEGTWPGSTSVNELTQKLLILIENREESIDVTWHVDGNGNDGNRCISQLAHHLYAYLYLCEQHISDKNLTIEILRETHSRLLRNSIDDAGNIIRAGVFRTTTVLSGSTLPNAPAHLFPPADLVPGLLQTAVDRYNSRRVNRTGILASPLAFASSLFYEFIDIHPFVNGNGRLARLLFAYSLLRDGFPFPIALQCGSDAARLFYLQAIERARYSRAEQRISLKYSNHSGDYQKPKLSCENYNVECLDYLVQLGLFSMFSIASDIDSNLLQRSNPLKEVLYHY